MDKKRKRIGLVAAGLLAVVCLLSACGKQAPLSPEDYFDDEYTGGPVRIINGPDTLTFAEDNLTWTMENQNVRLVLSKASGAVRELANKQSGLYLVQNGTNEIPLVILKRTGEGVAVSSPPLAQVKENSPERLALELTWRVDKFEVTSTISLAEGSDEIVFGLDSFTNKNSSASSPDRQVLAVEYPYLPEIGSLFTAQTDKLLHSYATGYVFDNPKGVFNGGTFPGITRDLGLYPYGFASTMQFMAYYAEGIGGFHFETRDSGEHIKSFSMVGENNTLTAGIWNYLDDPTACRRPVEFYDIAISCLTKGSWQESCQRYRAFAEGAPWSNRKGKLAEREDYNKALFEETTLVNFAPHMGKNAHLWPDWENTYRVLQENAGGKIYNIMSNDWQAQNTGDWLNGDMESFFPAALDMDYYSMMSKSDLVSLFEFSNLYNTKYPSDNAAVWAGHSTADVNGAPNIFYNSFDSCSWYYMCPTEDWYQFALEKSRIMAKDYDVDLYYHDCSFTVAPRTCYNKQHAHGTRSNIVPDQVAFERRLAEETGKSVGLELISEVYVGTADYYQARGNAGGMGFMDNNDLRVLVDANRVKKVPAFDYVYHEYGIVRMDGFMKPLAESGDPYYYIMALTALNGGIPEYNYEYLKAPFNTNEMDADMLRYLKKLGELKRGAGSKYLTFGRMLPGANTGAGTVRYEYFNSSYIDNKGLRGEMVVDKVVSSAFAYGDKVALFFSNVTAEDIRVNFVVNAGRDYGVTQGSVYLGSEKVGEVKDGKAYLSLNLGARDVTMLTIEL